MEGNKQAAKEAVLLLLAVRFAPGFHTGRCGACFQFWVMDPRPTVTHTSRPDNSQCPLIWIHFHIRYIFALPLAPSAICFSRFLPGLWRSGDAASSRLSVAPFGVTPEMLSLGCRHTNEGKLMYKHYLTVHTALLHTHTHPPSDSCISLVLLSDRSSLERERGSNGLRSALPETPSAVCLHGGAPPPSGGRWFLRGRQERAPEELIKGLYLRGGQRRGRPDAFSIP